MVAFTPPQASLDEPSHSELRREMATLRQKFDGVALYGTGPATAAIISLAEELHYRAVLITVWDPASDSELATAASLLNGNSTRIVMAVSIGAEGIMQQRYTVEDMERARSKLLARLDNAPAVEMTTTEPWWMYTKGDRTASILNHFGEFTSCNIHAVWDTAIADPALAASWTLDRARQVRSVSGAPVLIREGGFPGQGRSPLNEDSPAYSRAKQATFWRTWLQLSRAENGIHAVAFEAVDNPAKQWREFEANWGLLDPDLHAWPAWLVFPDQASAGLKTASRHASGANQREPNTAAESVVIARGFAASTAPSEK